MADKDFFTFDDQTKETMIASIVGLLIAEVVVFFGGFLVGRESLGALVWTVVYALIGGAVAGFLLSKLYDPIMDFVSRNLSFLMPICNTFFKFLFVPVVIGSVIGLLFGLLAGAAVTAVGFGLGGVGGGILGGFLGGSIILATIWGIAVTLVARFIYAWYMASLVGKYYKDYK